MILTGHFCKNLKRYTFYKILHKWGGTGISEKNRKAI